jgi:hypothetical protein
MLPFLLQVILHCYNVPMYKVQERVIVHLLVVTPAASSQTDAGTESKGSLQKRGLQRRKT